MSYTLNEWNAAKTAYLREKDLREEYQQRFYDLQSVEPDKMRRSEMVETQMGIDYKVLKPYLERHVRDKQRRAGKRRDSEPVAYDLEKAKPADDVRDIRWAMAHLSDEAVLPADAPSPIAWNLVVAGRQNQAGLLKLMEIYRQVVVPKGVDSTAANAATTDDGRLSELVARLSGEMISSESED